MQVSVITPVYNAEAFVAEAVASALAQPETGEVLLIEDGSPDGSLAACEALASRHDRVRLLRHPDDENRGAAETRNVGLRHARHEFIAFLDADDMYLPGRFQPAREIFNNHPEIDGVYDAVGVQFDDEGARCWWQSKGGEELTTVRRHVAPEELLSVLVRGTDGYFHTDGIVVRRRLIELVGEFDPHLRMCQDTAMWTKMAALGRLAGGALDRPVAVRRLHAENRIFRDQADHIRYGLQMFETLHRWAVDNGLDRSTQRLLLEGVLRNRVAVQAHKYKAQPWRRALACCRELGRFGLRHPWIAGNSVFYRYWLVALGAGYLRRMIQRPARQEVIDNRQCPFPVPADEVQTTDKAP